MRNEYLAHHGVKGMKWGVRRDRRAANKARRRAEKEAYKRELAAPGSQSKNDISTKRLAAKRSKNIAGAVLLGYEAIGDAYNLGVLGVSAANAMAVGGSAMAVGQALIPMALGVGGVGVAAGVGTVALAKRAKSIDTSIALRDNPNDAKAKRQAEKITQNRAKKEQARRAKADSKTYKRAAKEAGLKVNKDTVKNIKKGSANLKDSQRDIQRRVKRKADIEDRAASNAAKVLSEMKSKQAAGTMTKEDRANFNKQLKDNSSDYYKQLRELGFK